MNADSWPRPTSEYDPKYVVLEDVPFGSHNYGEGEKRSALSDTESQLEADVNDGAEIQTPKRIHTRAVRNLCTYHLLRPATGPSEARYGDVAEFGENQLEYLQTYKEEYEAIVESINAASPDEVDGGDDTTDGEPGGGFDPAFEFEAF